MAYQSQWYFSTFPEKLVDLIEREVGEDSTVSADSWVGGFVWHFLKRANRENFCYELSHLDGDSIKYKVYNEGEGQTWHVDAKPLEDEEEEVRKISFTVQLSDLDDYEGGNIQFLDEGGRMYNAPRKRGAVILFDSSARHRVNKVTKGTRKSLVGWAVGKRWQ